MVRKPEENIDLHINDLAQVVIHDVAAALLQNNIYALQHELNDFVIFLVYIAGLFDLSDELRLLLLRYLPILLDLFDFIGICLRVLTEQLVEQVKVDRECRCSDSLVLRLGESAHHFIQESKSVDSV